MLLNGHASKLEPEALSRGDVVRKILDLPKPQKYVKSWSSPKRTAIKAIILQIFGARVLLNLTSKAI